MDFKESILEYKSNGDRTVIDRIISYLDTDFLGLRHQTEDGFTIDLKEPEEYVAYRVKAKISPYLRNARSVRNGTKTRWYRFNDLINGDNYHENGFVGINRKYGLNLSRQNSYSIPMDARKNMSDDFLGMLDEEIAFFNELHRKEDALKEELFTEALGDWAIPALEYALERVDTDRSNKEIVSYINRVFYTKYIELRAKSQGLVRKRVDGRWVYYEPKQEFDEDDYRNQQIMEIIFKREEFNYPKRWDRVKILTQRQFLLIDRIEAVIRDDIRRNDKAYFMKNYNHGKMKYNYMASKLGVNYDAFIKNMQRIELKIFAWTE